jgi:hypothetical protein
MFCSIFLELFLTMNAPASAPLRKGPERRNAPGGRIKKKRRIIYLRFSAANIMTCPRRAGRSRNGYITLNVAVLSTFPEASRMSTFQSPFRPPMFLLDQVRYLATVRFGVWVTLAISFSPRVQT